MDKKRNLKNKNIIIYTSEDGQIKVDVPMDGETVWLSQKQMAELFNKDENTIGEHIQNIYKEGELFKDPTTRDFRVVQREKGRLIQRIINHYNLDVIISVGYRVHSIRGTQFRIWATKLLKEYIIKGFAMDDERLANGGVQKTYFEEWEERIRKIRISERNFYLKVTDIFATSLDYDPKTDYAKRFFASVQNKFHYAITGLTAAELIDKRVDANKKNMGLTNWNGEVITRDQAEIAKNYLKELELKQLMLLVEQFLSFAELQATKKKTMNMKDWVARLDDFVVLNKGKILMGPGHISHQDMENKVRKELEKFNRKRLGNKKN